LQSNISRIEETHSIVELDWHESHTISKDDTQKLEVTPVPMQHWGSRVGFDRDTTLWCGFSMKSLNLRQSALFCGDTGWFEECKTDIGDKYGPYDLAMIPIGAYDPYDFMRPQHNNPEDAVEMFKGVQAKKAVPIHWGTFQLTREPVMEPRERLAACMEKEGLEQTKFPSWLIGETVVVDPSNDA
jgi:L-ascorbate metabolism protein UlaG (beta-lactamase superfamily)